MSLIRKVFWPATVALGFLLLLGAVGTNVSTIQAASGDAEFCKIVGPTRIAEGQTALYVAYIQDNDDAKDQLDEADVFLDDESGDSDITSLLEGGEVDDYTELNSGVDVIQDVETVDAESYDEGLVDFLKSHFGFQFDGNVCGDGAKDSLIDGIDARVICDGNGDGDCIDSGESISNSALNAIAKAIEDAVDKGQTDDCADLGDVAEEAAIDQGLNEALASNVGGWIEAACEQDGSEACANDDVGTDPACETPDAFLDDTMVVDVTCEDAGMFELTFSDSDDPEDSITIEVECAGAPDDSSTVSVAPATVEIIPALGSVSHAFVRVTTLADDEPASPGFEVDFTTDRCTVESGGVDTVDEWGAAVSVFGALNSAVPASAAAVESSAAATAAVDSTRQADTMTSILLANGNTVAGTILGCGPADTGATVATPGVATITVVIEVVDGQDVVKSVKVTVVGPPASITVAASPSTLRCGEKATITATVKDAIGQNVSDHSKIEAVTNAGGVLGGTGAVAALAGPVVPISSTVGETNGGTSVFYLLTSESHSGPYEVVVTAGGGGSVASGGVFSTAAVSAQATVTCSIPQAAAPVQPTTTAPVQPPRTGQGITPPNTGDAGLADSGSSSSLWLLAGAVAFALAGVAAVKFARR